MRGEYRRRWWWFPRWWELPPRARRILCTTADFCDVFGTTSACAENTNGIPLTTLTRWNYLRVRGEYTPSPPCRGTAGELPPRARRIPAEVTADPRTLGTTSACAENTMPTIARVRQSWNYLRVRGEYKFVGLREVTRQELPPRARRIPFVHPQKVRMLGTTSACAENTHTCTIRSRTIRNYLRVRGEYDNRPYHGPGAWELPPRARRIPFLQVSMLIFARTTSACAENTKEGREFDGVLGNYLRVRGEY